MSVTCMSATAPNATSSEILKLNGAIAGIALKNRIKEQQMDLFADRTSTHWNLKSGKAS
jgi:hypothetical protein